MKIKTAHDPCKKWQNIGITVGWRSSAWIKKCPRYWSQVTAQKTVCSKILSISCPQRPQHTCQKTQKNASALPCNPSPYAAGRILCHHPLEDVSKTYGQPHIIPPWHSHWRCLHNIHYFEWNEWGPTPQWIDCHSNGHCGIFIHLEERMAMKLMPIDYPGTWLWIVSLWQERNTNSAPFK